MVANEITSRGEPEASQFVFFITYLAQVSEKLFIHCRTRLTAMNAVVWSLKPIGVSLPFHQPIFGRH